MNLVQIYAPLQNLLNKMNVAEGLAPLLLRLYLAPIMIQAGYNKYAGFESTVWWFENSLNLPFPTLMASLAVAAEIGGGIAILIGLATRWASIPLMVTMLVAIFSVHIENGWAALADAGSWLSDGTIFLNESVMEAPDKKAAAISILKEHGNYNWLTSSGSITILNNGIEFGATYFIMLFSLFFTGGGRYTSVDYFLNKKFGSND